MLAQLAVTDHLQIWRHRLAEPGPVPMLVCQDDVVIGLLYWQPSLEEGLMTARIRALYLHPDHWRQGHGKRLWQAVAVQMRRAGCECVRLWLLDGNHIGEGFYLRRGFMFDGQERTPDEPRTTLPTTTNVPFALSWLPFSPSVTLFLRINTMCPIWTD